MLPIEYNNKFFEDYKNFVNKQNNYVKPENIFEHNKVLKFSYKECEKNEFLQYIRKNYIVKKGENIYIKLYESNILKHFVLIVETKDGETFDIPKKYAKYIVGKKGENLKKLKELLKEKDLCQI